MPPKVSTILALIAVLLAGIPLPTLTGARREASAAAAVEAEVEAPTAPQTRLTYATLQCSGQPEGLSLLHEGRQLAELTAEQLAATPVELELRLPTTGSLELEVTASWGEGAPAPQAVSLTLEPEGLSTRQDTQWTQPGDSTLHSLFSFSW